MSDAAARRKRPVYLNLVEIRLPLPAFVSILHRASGAFLFVAVVWLLFMLDRSLASESGFEAVKRYLQLAPVKLGLLAVVWAYCHHICAGVRFLLLDLHKGTELATARMTSGLVLAVSLALTAFFGWKLW
jgi:succinate dehydrogenase / fumarate reductase cytochrome b subunit